MHRLLNDQENLNFKKITLKKKLENYPVKGWVVYYVSATDAVTALMPGQSGERKVDNHLGHQRC